MMFKSRLWKYFSLLVLLMGIWTQAAFGDDWLAPNEHFPMVGDCVYQQVQPGRVYVSVGTERGFMGAAKTKASALYVTDIDPDVIRFAQINRALIAASENTAEYRHLRLEATADEWNTAAQKFTNDADSEYKTALTQKDAWDWWNKEVRQNQGWDSGFQLLAAQPSAHPDPEKEAFAGFNYLWDDALFQNLKALTASHSIWAEHPVNLTHLDELDQMLDWVTSRGMQFGAIDTSNVPDYWQATLGSSASYFQFLASNVAYDTIFLNTETGNGASWWSYYGFSAFDFEQATFSCILQTVGNEVSILGKLGDQHEYTCRYEGSTVGRIWIEPQNRLRRLF